MEECADGDRGSVVMRGAAGQGAPTGVKVRRRVARQRRQGPRTVDDLLAWAELTLGLPVVLGSDRSESHDKSLVLELKDSNGERWFLKYPRDKARFQREVTAYETVLASLGDRVPRMVGSSLRYQCLLIAAAPGALAADGPGANDPIVHRAAGVWLADLHASAPAEPATEMVGEKFQRRSASLIARTVDLLEPSEVEFVRRATMEIPERSESVTVPCHRDYSPRNWMVDEHGTLRVIDFGLAGWDLAVRDFSRLAHRIWLFRPELREAFFAGYGRQLDEVEDRQLDGFVVMSAVRVMLRAHNQNDRAAVQRERRLLARLNAVSAGG